MIKLIGKNGCNRCQMTKTILDNNNIKYEYILLEDLETKEQDKYIQLATEYNMVELPLIVIDNKLKTLQEIINN